MENKILKTEIIHKEIDLIQSCISRMANNSFLLKGWFISLIAVLLAILKENIDIQLVTIIIIVITLSFWYLDAFFLRTEKLYRVLYSWVLKERALGNNEYLYDLSPSVRFSKDVDTIISVMFSKTLVCFYLIPSLSIFTIINVPKIILFISKFFA